MKIGDDKCREELLSSPNRLRDREYMPPSLTGEQERVAAVAYIRRYAGWHHRSKDDLYQVALAIELGEHFEVAGSCSAVIDSGEDDPVAP